MRQSRNDALQGTTIVDNDNLRVDHWRDERRPASRLAYTFIERQRLPAHYVATRDSNGFGGDLLLRNGFDLVCFKPARGDSYQSLSQADLDRVNEYVTRHGLDHLQRVG